MPSSFDPKELEHGCTRDELIQLNQETKFLLHIKDHSLVLDLVVAITINGNETVDHKKVAHIHKDEEHLPFSVDSAIAWFWDFKASEGICEYSTKLLVDREFAVFVGDVLSDDCEDKHHRVRDCKERSTIFDALSQNRKFLSGEIG